MLAEAVLYVGDLGRMQDFYTGCFGLTVADSGDGYRGLANAAWLLTLVRSADARPATDPAERRADTPVKLGFRVASIAGLRPTIAALGGRVNDREWEFRDAIRCDCVDPEGNVVQLIQPG